MKCHLLSVDRKRIGAAESISFGRKHQIDHKIGGMDSLISELKTSRLVSLTSD